MGNTETKRLFVDSVHSLSEGNRMLLSNELKELDRNAIIQLDIEKFCSYVQEQYGFDVPVLSDEPELLVPEPVSFKRPDPFDSRRLISVSGMKYEMAIGFRGDSKLFLCRPSTYTNVYPHARIVENEIRIAYLVQSAQTSHQLKEFQTEFAKDFVQIKQYLEWLRQDADSHNRQLDQITRDVLRRKKEEVTRADQAAGELGFTIRRRSNAPETYLPTVTKRNLPIYKPAAQTKIAEVQPLGMDEYEHILYVISNMALVMERSPRAFGQIKEEDLRFHFLVQLNGQYEGQATGETFNAEGKTDILIRAGGQTLFVAECKYWGGEATAIEAINQLLGYLTWRDTKAALIFFNRNKNLTKVLQQIPTIIASHPSFVRNLPRKNETEFRCIFRHKDDPSREVMVTVMNFDVPQLT